MNAPACAAPPRGAKSLPDIISLAFTIYVRNAKQFLLLGLLGAALSVLEFALVQWVGTALGLKVLSNTDNAQTSHVSAGPVFLVLSTVILSTALINFLADALVVPAAFDALLSRRLDFRAIWIMFAASLQSVLLAWIVVGVAATVGIMLVIAIPLVLFWMVRISLVIQVIVREGLPAMQALSRSSQLVKGMWWRVCGIQVAIIFLSALPGIALRPLSSGINGSAVDYVIVGLSPWLALPFAAIARTVLYADVKLRKGEHLDTTSPASGGVR